MGWLPGLRFLNFVNSGHADGYVNWKTAIHETYEFDIRKGKYLHSLNIRPEESDYITREEMKRIALGDIALARIRGVKKQGGNRAAENISIGDFVFRDTTGGIRRCIASGTVQSSPIGVAISAARVGETVMMKLS